VSLPPVVLALDVERRAIGRRLKVAPLRAEGITDSHPVSAVAPGQRDRLGLGGARLAQHDEAHLCCVRGDEVKLAGLVEGRAQRCPDPADGRRGVAYSELGFFLVKPGFTRLARHGATGPCVNLGTCA
jgi:hypothetical protein